MYKQKPGNITKYDAFNTMLLTIRIIITSDYKLPVKTEGTIEINWIKRYLIYFNPHIVWIGCRFVDGRHEFTQQFMFPVVDSPT